MNLKKHYKLYKSGKLWVTAAIATLALTTGMVATTTTNASADAQPAQEKETEAPNTQSSAGTATNTNDSTTPKGNDQNSSANNGNNTNKPDNDKQTDKDQNQPQQVTDKVTVSRKINYVTQDENGKQTSSSSVPQSVSFTRTQTVDKDGKVTKQGEWAAAPANKDTKLEVPAIQVPAQKGYVSQVDGKYTDEIAALALSTDDLEKALKSGKISEKDVTVTYIPSTKQQTITPADDKDKTKVYDNSKKADDPANQEAVWKAVTRKITVVNIQGDAPTVINQTVWYNRTVTIKTMIDASGKETSEYDPSAWKLADGQQAVWEEYDIPQIPSFTSVVGNQQIVTIPKQSVDINTADTTINVTYYNDADDPVNSDVNLGLQGNWGYIDVQPRVDGSS